MFNYCLLASSQSSAVCIQFPTVRVTSAIPTCVVLATVGEKVTSVCISSFQIGPRVYKPLHMFTYVSGDIVLLRAVLCLSPASCVSALVSPCLVSVVM